MDTTIISLGGSIVAPEEIDTDFLRKFKEFVMGIEGRVALIVGGGKICRNYQQAGKELGLSDEDLDWVGIHTTRMNAELVRMLFGEDAYESVVVDPSVGAETDKKVIVGAGWKPGWSTDYCSVTLAETLGGKTVLNLSNIKQAYTKDPNKYPDAEPIDTISWGEFRKIVGDEWVPGLNMPFDPIAAKKAQELGLRVAVLEGRDLENISAFLSGKDFVGTLIE